MGKCILGMAQKRCFNLYTSRKTHWKFNSIVLQIKCIHVMAIWLVKCQTLKVTMFSVSECIHLISQSINQSINKMLNPMYNTHVCFGRTMQSVGHTEEGTAVTLVIILNSFDLWKHCRRHSIYILWFPMFNQGKWILNTKMHLFP